MTEIFTEDNHLLSNKHVPYAALINIDVERSSTQIHLKQIFYALLDMTKKSIVYEDVFSNENPQIYFDTNHTTLLENVIYNINDRINSIRLELNSCVVIMFPDSLTYDTFHHLITEEQIVLPSCFDYILLLTDECYKFKATSPLSLNLNRNTLSHTFDPLNNTNLLSMPSSFNNELSNSYGTLICDVYSIIFSESMSTELAERTKQCIRIIFFLMDHGYQFFYDISYQHKSRSRLNRHLSLAQLSRYPQENRTHSFGEYSNQPMGPNSSTSYYHSMDVSYMNRNQFYMNNTNESANLIEQMHTPEEIYNPFNDMKPTKSKTQIFGNFETNIPQNYYSNINNIEPVHLPSSGSPIPSSMNLLDSNIKPNPFPEIQSSSPVPNYSYSNQFYTGMNSNTNIETRNYKYSYPLSHENSYHDLHNTVGTSSRNGNNGPNYHQTHIPRSFSMSFSRSAYENTLNPGPMNSSSSNANLNNSNMFYRSVSSSNQFNYNNNNQTQPLYSQPMSRTLSNTNQHYYYSNTHSRNVSVPVDPQSLSPGLSLSPPPTNYINSKEKSISQKSTISSENKGSTLLEDIDLQEASHEESIVKMNEKDNEETKLLQEQKRQENYNKLKSSGSRTLRLRGLPFSATIQEIQSFFSPLILCPDEDAIIIGRDNKNRPSGEAFVTFVSNEEALKGLAYDHKYIGNRYIEIFGTIDKQRRHNNTRNQTYQNRNKNRNYVYNPEPRMIPNNEQQANIIYLNNPPVLPNYFNNVSMGYPPPYPPNYYPM